MAIAQFQGICDVKLWKRGTASCRRPSHWPVSPVSVSMFIELLIDLKRSLARVFAMGLSILHSFANGGDGSAHGRDSASQHH
ncbi:MAG: hypothetical protein AAGK37_20085, partial [Pseudomonadota bacterium]